jgi:Fe-S-cluster containining protein
VRSRRQSSGDGAAGAGRAGAGAGLAGAGLEELRAVYAEVDALLVGWTCDASTDCCRFGVTGREPYPTAVELAELERAVRARGGLPKRRSLPTVGGGGAGGSRGGKGGADGGGGRKGGGDERRCALLSDGGKCLVYASRPFGCRTFFCDRARGPAGEPARATPKGEIARLSRAIADLSARFEPGDPGPRPLSKATAAWDERGGTRHRRG